MSKKMKDMVSSSKIYKADVDLRKRLLISVPLTGLIRAEWALARWSQTIPCNWAQQDMIQWLDQFSPMGFLVADARNVAVRAFMEGTYEWLFFIDHDVCLPPNTFNTWNEYMLKGDIPIFGGLYFTKGYPSEPLMYRGRGTGYYANWKMGDKVWIDGMGMGCTVIHRSILETVWNESPEYAVGITITRKVFDTPNKSRFDPTINAWISEGGTEDLTFYSRIMREEVFKRSGWSKFQKMKYPLLCDTNIFCKHIDYNGVQYPNNGEERLFIK